MTIKIEDSTEYEKLMWPLITTFQPIACWPNRSEIEGVRNIKNVLRIFNRYLAIVIIFLITFGTISESVHYWGEDMNDTIECSLIASACAMALFRVVLFSTKQKDMLFVVEMMKKDWTKSSIEDKLLLRHKCLLAFKLAKFFIISVAVGSSSFVVLPLLEMMSGEDYKKELPFRGYYYFNHTGTPIFECVFFANAILGMIGCSTIAAATSFSLIATIHGAAKFYIVQQDFQSISSSEWVLSEKLTKCVQRHQECIRFAEAVEKVISYIALAQFMISTGLLCFAGFQLTTMLEDKARLTKYWTFLQSAIMELFIFSYSGQCLKTESENVAEYVYSSNWIGIFSPTSIQLVVMRARKPCTITAGKFYDMSLESFLKVLSSSFSYFTVLLAMQEEQ